jgi:hypothetical protein
MDPQQPWRQHKVLAEDFCVHDERVRLAKEVLREAQMHRNRSLAALAVTVGRDRSVADLLGLSEREVRSARRKVGKSSARIVAGNLLDASTASKEHRHAAERSRDQDAGLGVDWNQGDLHVLAAQLGTDAAGVVARLKELPTQGTLRANDVAAPKGRHRKRSERAGSHTVETAPHQHPTRRPMEWKTVSQDMAESWAAWENQLTYESNNSTVGAVTGVAREDEDGSPSRYDHY